MWPFKKKQIAAPEPVKEPEKVQIKINPMAVAAIQAKPPREFKRYEPPKGVIPENIRSAVLAMDSCDYGALNAAYQNGYAYGDLDAFPGYPYLSMMAQKPEYRKMVSIIAEKMTAKWIKLKTVGDDDKSDRVKRIMDALDRYEVRDRFKEAAEHDGYFGGGQIYVDVQSSKNVSAWTDDTELQSKLFISPKKIPKGSLKGFRVIEPVWTYPGVYNAQNPLSPDFYKPAEWFVMGKTVHSSRMLDFVSRPVPDLLKASYNFRGLSLVQIAEPYVNNWLRTRDSVSDMIHSFSVPVLSTDMQNILSGGAADTLLYRLQMFNQCRDNRGAFAVDNDPTKPEGMEFKSAPLTGLDTLQAQSQEHMSSVSGIPFVFLLGLTPGGLNASSDGEIRVFYDWIHALQNAVYRPPLKRTIDIIQLSEFGDIDPDITFDFEPLYELSAKERADVRKTDAETDAVYVAAGALSNNEVREKIASDPESPYHSLDLSDDIEIEESEFDEEEESEPDDDKPDKG